MLHRARFALLMLVILSAGDALAWSIRWSGEIVEDGGITCALTLAHGHARYRGPGCRRKRVRATGEFGVGETSFYYLEFNFYRRLVPTCRFADCVALYIDAGRDPTAICAIDVPFTCYGCGFGGPGGGRDVVSTGRIHAVRIDRGCDVRNGAAHGAVASEPSLTSPAVR